MKISSLQNLFQYKSFNPIKRIVNPPALFKTNKDTFEKFKPLMYKKAVSVDEGKEFARKNFYIYDISCKNVKDINQMNSCLCNIYNMNKGKIFFPHSIKVYKNKGQRFAGSYIDDVVFLNSSYSIPLTLSHEIAHLNHEKMSPNYLKMGKKNEMTASGIDDFSIFEKFMADKPSLKLIKKEISGYACSSPAEFTACTFESIMSGKKLSPEIWRLYKEYEGPNADILKQYFK